MTDYSLLVGLLQIAFIALTKDVGIFQFIMLCLKNFTTRWRHYISLYLNFPSNDSCHFCNSLMTMNVWISTLRFSASFVIRTQEGKQTLHCVMEGIVQGAMSQFLL